MQRRGLQALNFFEEVDHMYGVDEDISIVDDDDEYTVHVPPSTLSLAGPIPAFQCFMQKSGRRAWYAKSRDGERRSNERGQEGLLRSAVPTHYINTAQS